MKQKTRSPLKLLAMVIAVLLTLLAWEQGVLLPTSSGSSDPVPAFSPPGGYYAHDIEVTLRPPAPGIELRYTLDGSLPTLDTGCVYTRPIVLKAATQTVAVIRARAVLSEHTLGPVATASYFMRIDATLPLLSLIIEPDDLWDPQTGLYLNPLEAGEAWERPVDLTYIDKDRRSGFHIPAGLRIHGGFSRTFDQKSFRLYFRDEYGANRLEYPLFDTGSVTSFKRLVLHSGAQDASREDLNWTLMRNQVIARLVEQTGGNTGRSQAALVFINGQPWGLYHIRERLDSWFLADHYGIEDADLLDTPDIDNREMPPEVGDYKHWDHLIDYIKDQDLNDPAIYAYVTTQVDLDNLIDYMIIQIYSANSDWLHRNIDQFRSRTAGARWEWFFWDNDWSLGLNPYSAADTDTLARVLDPEDERTDGEATLLLQGLLENPDFRDRFLRRTADLLNTYLAPPNVTTQIDEVAAELAPDIHYEAERWASIVPWENSVQELRDFAQVRPAILRQQYSRAFGLEGTVPLTFQPPASGEGRVAVNGSLLPFLPWQGHYFVGVPIELTAVPAPGYRFAGWEEAARSGKGLSFTHTVTLSETVTPRFEPTDPAALQPGDVTIAAVHIDETGEIEGDWIELHVQRLGGIDLRRWRLTDNDTKTASDEGSLILPDIPALARVPRHTILRIVATVTSDNTERFPEDDLNAWDRQVILYAGNGAFDTTTDPRFDLIPGDTVVLLAPGATTAFDDDQGIDFFGTSRIVTPASFGVLVDGVTGETTR